MNSGDIDPWSGDDVPVAPSLGEIVWDTPSAHAAAEGIDAETVTGHVQPRGRRLLVPAVAVAAVGIILLAIFAWPDRSEPSTDEPASTAPAVPTTLDTLPPATTSTTSSPTATQPPDDRGVASADVIDAITGGLPEVLAEAELPTEVIVVTGDGELVTISLPGGDVIGRVDLELSRASRFQLGSNLLVVSPDASMYAGGNELIVTPRGGPALAVDRDDFSLNGDIRSTQIIPYGWVVELDGDAVFVVISFDSAGRQAEWLVTGGGEVSPAPAQRSGSFARPIYSLGTRFVDDAGGAYRVDPNGDSNRISAGEILATSETRVLLRECNANRVCSTVLRDYNGQEVRTVDLPPTFRPRFYAASLSPDGNAVTFADPNLSGERTIIDFDTGETLLFAAQGSDQPAPSWTAESTGILTFGSEGGIRFLDRVSGEEFRFALDLGQIQAIATRSPGG